MFLRVVEGVWRLRGAQFRKGKARLVMSGIDKTGWLKLAQARAGKATLNSGWLGEAKLDKARCDKAR